MPGYEPRTSRGERIHAIILASTIVFLALLYFVPKTTLEWRIDSAIRCGASCLTEQQAVVTDVYHESNGEQRVESFKIRLANGRSVTIHVDFTYFKVVQNQRVAVELYGDEVVTIDGRYARQHWSGDMLVIFMFVPAAIVIALLQGVRLRFGVASWDKRSSAYAAWASVVASILTGLLCIKCHWWELPTLVAGVILPLIGYAILGLFYRLKYR